VTAGVAPGSRAPRRNTAVAAVLGPELHGEVRKTDGKGEVDIEVLLRGVEKLNAVYEIRGTTEKVRTLRERWRAVGNSVKFYEQKVDRQTKELERMNRGERWESGAEDDDDENEEAYEEVEVTDEDLAREEEEIRELEAKKKALEERLKGMERDLGGLLR
jgi:chromosome segregation ATPase